MRVREINGKSVPTFLYGTAWKEKRTKQLVKTAVKNGFTGIDTANQRCHYYEAAVGEALQELIQEGQSERAQLFLQTKFTYIHGQDDRLPYDPEASHSQQVQQSFASSLEHLHTSYLDSYVLHGPYMRSGLADADWEVWQTMTEFYQSGQTKLLGVSNVSAEQLETLVQQADVKPHFVQNRCFARTAWDKLVREVCAKHGIIYQGFSLLTANIRELNTPAIAKIMQNHQRTLPQIVFRFALQAGMILLTGTTQEKHMREDLEVYNFALNQEEVKVIESVAL